MKVYHSKFGHETIVFLTIIYGSILGFMIYKHEPIQAILAVGGIFFVTYIFCLYLSLATKYIITNNSTLKVTCGFVYNKEFEIEKFKSIKKTNTLISSPAPSLDRIELTHGKFDSLIISPKNKVKFAKALTKINPNIKNNLM